MSTFSLDKLLATISNEVGYLGKKTDDPQYLNDKTANAGYKNGHTYTKYGKYLDDLGWLYNSKKNGYAWCAIFAAWAFFVSFGNRNSEKMLCMHDKCSAAGCGEWFNYFVRNKRNIARGQGQPGDLVFFVNSAGTDIIHVGIVESVKGSIMTTIEGNASNSVRRKTYGIWDGRIFGFGRPDWDMTPVEPIPEDAQVIKEPEHVTPVSQVTAPATSTSTQTQTTTPATSVSVPANNEITITLPILKEGASGTIVKNLQYILQRNKCFSGTINGKFDKATASAVRSFQNGKGLKITSPAEVNAETWNKLFKG